MNFICPKCSTPLSFEPEKKLSVCPSCDPVVFESGAYSLMSFGEAEFEYLESMGDGDQFAAELSYSSLEEMQQDFQGMSSEEHRESQIFDFQDDLDEGFDDEI